jgi:hypothetical protein
LGGATRRESTLYVISVVIDTTSVKEEAEGSETIKHKKTFVT